MHDRNLIFNMSFRIFFIVLYVWKRLLCEVKKTKNTDLLANHQAGFLQYCQMLHSLLEQELLFIPTDKDHLLCIFQQKPKFARHFY